VATKEQRKLRLALLEISRAVYHIKAAQEALSDSRCPIALELSDSQDALATAIDWVEGKMNAGQSAASIVGTGGIGNG
jgi:hypothetical protein